ncbi:MAG: thiamine phosphate synthase, partial [Parvibaculales bacterium]
PQWQMARLGNLRQMAKKLNAPITIAAHGRASLLLGMKLGANAALLSPLFPTTSHSKARLLSPIMAASLCQAAGTFPLFALGGVRIDNFHKIAGLGFQGFAATDPYRTGFPPSSR